MPPIYGRVPLAKNGTLALRLIKKYPVSCKYQLFFLSLPAENYSYAYEYADDDTADSRVFQDPTRLESMDVWLLCPW